MKRLYRSDEMQLEKEGKLAWLTLTRASQLNAMNNDGTIALNRVAQAIDEDPDIRVVLIRGQGRAFCTGIDLKQLSIEKTGIPTGSESFSPDRRPRRGIVAAEQNIFF